jgi:hypothetical protein
MGLESLLLATLAGCVAALFFGWLADRRRSSIRSARDEARAREAERERLAITSIALERATAIRGAPRSLPAFGASERWDVWAPQIRSEAGFAAAVIAYAWAHAGAVENVSPEELGLRAVQWWHGISVDAPPHETLNAAWSRAQELPPIQPERL